MAYTVPTADDFRTRFPRFAAVADAPIDALIAEASAHVDDSWLEQDYATAILYLVAHLYQQEQGVAASRGTIVSESFGPMSTSYAPTIPTGGLNFGATEYGRRFQELQSRNFPAVLVV